MQNRALQFLSDAPAKAGKRLVKSAPSLRIVQAQAPLPRSLRKSIKTASLPDLVEDWILDGQTGSKKRRITKATAANRQVFLDRLIAFLQDRQYVVCSERECREFLALVASRCGSPATERSYHAYIASFFAWLVKIEQLDESPMKHIERNEEKPKPRLPLSKLEMKQLIAAAGVRKNPTRERDVAIIRFIWDSGLRVSELCSLNMGDVTIRQGSISGQVLGKGKKWRQWFGEHECANAVRAYLRVRYKDWQGTYDESRIQPSDPLFLSTGRYAGRRMTPSGIAYVLEKAVKQAIEQTGGQFNAKATAHILRHTFVRDIFRNGVDMPGAQALLGHSDPRQTMHYGKVFGTDLQELHRRVSPADNARED